MNIEDQILSQLHQEITPENRLRVRNVINWFVESMYKSPMSLAHELVDEFEVPRRGNRKPLSDWLSQRMDQLDNA